MDTPMGVVYQHGHPQIFFIAKDFGSTGFLIQGAVGR